MKIGIFGMGRAGVRHANNANVLGHILEYYDPATQFNDRHKVLECDVIIIASPSCYHLQDLRDCIAARKPVLVEKPIGLCGQSRYIEDLLTEENLPPIAVGYNLRFHPAIQEIKKGLNGHDPYHVDVWCCQRTDSLGPLTNGCLNEWACHEIDIAQYLARNPLRLIDKYVDRFTVDLALRTWEGERCHVNVHSDMRYHGNVRGGLVVIEKDHWQYDLAKIPVTNEDYKAELASFLAWVETGKHDGILATAEDGLAALQIAERADSTRWLSK